MTSKNRTLMDFVLNHLKIFLREVYNILQEIKICAGGILISWKYGIPHFSSSNRDSTGDFVQNFIRPKFKRYCSNLTLKINSFFYHGFFTISDHIKSFLVKLEKWIYLGGKNFYKFFTPRFLQKIQKESKNIMYIFHIETHNYMSWLGISFLEKFFTPLGGRG